MGQYAKVAAIDFDIEAIDTLCSKIQSAAGVERDLGVAVEEVRKALKVTIPTLSEVTGVGEQSLRRSESTGLDRRVFVPKEQLLLSYWLANQVHPSKVHSEPADTAALVDAA